MGRLGARSGDLCAGAGGDRRRRRLGVHHGVGAQFSHLHRDRPLRHRRAEGPLAAAAGERRGGRLVRADRAAGGVRRFQPAHAGGEARRPLRDQRGEAVHQQRGAAGQCGAVRGDRSGGRQEGAVLLRGGQGDAGVLGGAARRKSWGRRRPTPVRCRSTTWRCRRTSASAPRARAIASRCPRWRAAASASPRRASAWRARRWTTRWSTPRSARRSAGASSTSRRWGSGWSMRRPGWRRRGR